MDNDTRDQAGKFQTVQPLRDLESNWGVDIGKNLEDYLLKICAGQFTDGHEDEHFSVNFAEAALLIQGSIQVYSRKVEYLYNLVLHALEFISQTRSQDQGDNPSAQQEAGSSSAAQDEDDQFWVADDIPVEAKIYLDNTTTKDALDQFVKPPANLVVLEGDCLDSTGDGGELESYLLANNDLYRDFILLDPCDANAVDVFLKGEKSGDTQFSGYRGNSLMSKAHKSFLSPTRRSGGTPHKSSVKKGQDNFGQASHLGADKQNPENDFEPGPNFNSPYHDNYGFEADDNHSHDENFDDSGGDDDDPWKPLNPHEPGNLKVKPFRKGKLRKRAGMIKQISLASQFPLAKIHGTVCPELTETWEMYFRARERQQESRPPLLFEKLRESLVDGHANKDTLFPPETDDAENIFDDGINDFDHDDFDIPDVPFVDEQVNLQSDKNGEFVDHHYKDNDDTTEDPSCHANLEDLCRAHLDALLASITENEKQTELAARVSTWKQRIEHDLDEEDSRPPFDIHEYGETVLDKLSLDEDATSFTDVVKGREKHDIARTFSALLQLVNERKVDLDRGTSTDDSFCYTSANPFNVRLLSNERGPRKMQFGTAKKRLKSPISRKYKRVQLDGHHGRQSLDSSPSLDSNSTAILAQPTCKLSAKMKANGQKSTPDGKRRRRSRLA